MPEMPEEHAPQESKALRLARYLREFVGLRSTTVRDVDKYETVLWFGDMPQESDCQSPAWNDNFEPGTPWLEVRKQQFPKPPDPPEVILPWIDQQALRQATDDMPQLRQTVLLPDLEAEVDEGETPPLVAHTLTDHPEITHAYERYRPNWEVWSAEYRRRERVQMVYAELFRMHTQVRKQGEIVELVLGLGLLNWRSPVNGTTATIRRHIVTARVDLNFDPANGMIRLEGAADGAQLRIEDDMLEAELRPERMHYASVGDLLSAIGNDVWDRASMHTALKSWAGALHADSQWSANLKPGTDGEGRPVVSFAPALILRKRTQAGMARIYDAMINRLNNVDNDIPTGWRGLIDDEDDHDDSELSAIPDEATGRPTVGVQEIYFPLPANRDQRQIVEAINRRRGVLVQGPPGTGKSHTIANLMCHLLATGKRVLITAETGRALQVLKDKLPKEIQPLCVSLLGQGGDAFAELNSAVQGITTRHAAYSPGAYDDRIVEIDLELDTARRTLAKLDTELRSLREEETCPHSLANGAYQGTASAIAERVATERDRFDWLQLPLDAPDEPPVSEADVATWLRIRRSYDDDAITNSKLQLLPSVKLPTPAEFSNAVTGEREAKAAVEQLAELRSHVAYSPILALNIDGRAKLAGHLRLGEERRQKLDRFNRALFCDALTATLGGRHAAWHALRERSHELIGQVDRLLGCLSSTSVTIKADKEVMVIRADAAAVLEHLKAGGKWTDWGVFTPKTIKGRTYLRDQVAVDGQPADTVERLQAICEHLDLGFAIENMERAWADHGRLPAGSELRTRLAAIKEHVGILGEILQYAQDCLKLGAAMKSATPMIPEPDWQNGQAQEWLKIIDAAAIEERHRLAVAQVTACLRDLNVMRDLFDAHPLIASLIEAVKQRNVTAYSQAHAQVLRIEQIRSDQQQHQQTEAALGLTVPRLIDAVSASLDNAAWDDRFQYWEQAWHWAVADNWLRKRTDPAYQQQLWQRRHDTDKAIGGLLAESAALRAWTHFFKRLSTKESAALKSWREAVKAMGKGTGRSAKLERLRREARQYMDQCRDAIPIWIMPRYLVAEMIDPAPGRYDLVIVDEASQLGIESLFLFYIAKKMVVVGDDQQISPYGVGIADEAINGLQHHYLDGIPHQHALSAQSSLYGNAKIRFGQNIVLREHFRCMPEIIQFSNDLCYASNGTPLDPLRAYPANRLKPLVLRHVSDGYRTGSSQNALNEPEADALVAQIIACIDDPRYAGRTMGVISLQGDAQAKLIEHKLLERVEPEVIEERRLICGDAYAFQGDERHVTTATTPQYPNSLFAAYAAYDGPFGDDPRTVSAGMVAEGLIRIIETEGPMLAKRAYDIYLRGCGIKRMGHELRSTMNKALANAIRQGRVVSEDEMGKSGLIFAVVRVKGSQHIKLRSRGPRTFEEIPPSELQTIAKHLEERHNFKPGSDEHLRAVLECFDLKRLTTQVGTTLLEILEKKYPYAASFQHWLHSKETGHSSSQSSNEEDRLKIVAVSSQPIKPNSDPHILGMKSLGGEQREKDIDGKSIADGINQACKSFGIPSPEEQLKIRNQNAENIRTEIQNKIQLESARAKSRTDNAEREKEIEMERARVFFRNDQIQREKIMRKNELVSNIQAPSADWSQWVQTQISDPAKVKLGIICSRCGGDGGVNGGCDKCDGTGWE